MKNKNGKYTEDLENSMKLEVEYKNAKKNGKSTIWNDKGQLQTETIFKEGRPFGKFTIYEDGIKIKEGIANYPKGDSPYNRGSDYSVN